MVDVTAYYQNDFAPFYEHSWVKISW